MKNTADDTIYRTPKGTRVRIVKDKEFNRGQVSPEVYDMLQQLREELFVVAEVKNGKRWYGYKREDLMTEAEFLKKIK
jgi:hypothetical protein